jgi:hypothetical protein
VGVIYRLVLSAGKKSVALACGFVQGAAPMKSARWRRRDADADRRTAQQHLIDHL